MEAYAALLIGFLSKESENAYHSIALCLPGYNLKVLCATITTWRILGSLCEVSHYFVPCACLPCS